MLFEIRDYGQIRRIGFSRSGHKLLLPDVLWPWPNHQLPDEPFDLLQMRVSSRSHFGRSAIRSTLEQDPCDPQLMNRDSRCPAERMWHHKSVVALLQIALRLLADLIAMMAFAFRQRRATAAEILVLRRQLALYKERAIKPRRIDRVTRISLALLSRFFNWRDALVVVRPETMIRSERDGDRFGE